MRFCNQIGKYTIHTRKRKRYATKVSQEGSTYTGHTQIIGIQKYVTFRSAQKHHKGTGNTRRVTIKQFKDYMTP